MLKRNILHYLYFTVAMYYGIIKVRQCQKVANIAVYDYTTGIKTHGHVSAAKKDVQKTSAL